MDIEEYEPVKYTTEKFRKLYSTYEETKKKYRKIDFEDADTVQRSFYETAGYPEKMAGKISVYSCR